MGKNIQKIIILAIVISSVLPLNLFAQSTSGGRSRRGSSYQLTVNANVPASVIINSQTDKSAAAVTGSTSQTFTLVPGNYNIQVSANGYTAQSRVVVLDNNKTETFQLQATTARLNVTSNVNRAALIISGGVGKGSTINGTVPYQGDLAQGSYTVTISAEGYISQSRTVNLQRHENIHFNLEQAPVNLSVTSNVTGATVSVTGGVGKGSSMSGTIPFQRELLPGEYNITVSAQGYTSQTKTLSLTRASNLHFELLPSTGTVQVIIPPEYLNKKDVNARAQIKIYDNGLEISGVAFQLRPGQHTIQIVSGGLMSQATINVEAGRVYTIKPILTLSVE